MRHKTWFLMFLLTIAVLMTAACGDDPLPLAPTPEPSAAPTPLPNPTIRLSVVVGNGDGASLDAIWVDRYYTVTASPVCADSVAPCPPLVSVTWSTQGAFCEMLGDQNAVSRSVICRNPGVATFTATSGNATGSATVRVVK